MTNKQLLEFGMKENVGDFVYPMSKILAKGEDGTLEMVVTQERNILEIALKLPSGDTLYLGGAKDIEDLKTFEKCISSWEPVY